MFGKKETTMKDVEAQKMALIELQVKERMKKAGELLDLFIGTLKAKDDFSKKAKWQTLYDCLQTENFDVISTFIMKIGPEWQKDIDNRINDMVREQLGGKSLKDIF